MSTRESTPIRIKKSSRTPQILNIKQKTWLAKEVADFGKKSKDVRLRFGVSSAELKRWVYTYRKIGKLHDVGGRPALLSPAVAESIKAEIRNNKVEKTESEVVSIIQNAVNKERLSTTRLAECSLPTISSRSMLRIQQSIGFVSQNHGSKKL